ncbi:uncharacterized protein [Halyomorpha halys]|uniref:uncharacterized protein n=1 Tax=Halyomorpha halys TaxID=286706 RepID=UPI0006D4DE95
MIFLVVILTATFSALFIPTEGRLFTKAGGLCSFKNDSASCCVRIAAVWKICLVFQVSVNELKAYAALSVNGRVTALQELKVGEFCVPLPGATICLNIYWLDGSLRSKELDFCARVTLITPAFKTDIDLQCFSFKVGRFSLPGDKKPSSFSLPDHAANTEK